MQQSSVPKDEPEVIKYITIISILIIDNGVRRGTCRSNGEKRSPKGKNKKPSNKQNKPSMTFTRTTIIKKKKQLPKQGIYYPFGIISDGK
jgi:hypothetical protein